MSAHFSTARRSTARSYIRRHGTPWPLIVDTIVPICNDCGQPWSPICPTVKCPARKTVQKMIRVEDGEGAESFYGTTPQGWGRVGRAEAMRQRRAVERPGYSRGTRRTRHDARGRK